MFRRSNTQLTLSNNITAQNTLQLACSAMVSTWLLVSEYQKARRIIHQFQMNYLSTWKRCFAATSHKDSRSVRAAKWKMSLLSLCGSTASQWAGLLLSMSSHDRRRQRGGTNRGDADVPRVAYLLAVYFGSRNLRLPIIYRRLRSRSLGTSVFLLNPLCVVQNASSRLGPRDV